MSDAIEIEAKVLVSKDDYRLLTKEFASYPRYVQTNYYIDTEDRALAKEGIALRDEDEFPETDLKRFLTMLDFDVKQLRILTSLSTERIDVEYEGGLLSIDRNSYSGQVDYEIEFEYNNIDDAEKILEKLLASKGIKVAAFSKKSKTQRAMAAIGK